jgi:hypothetical protein
MQVKWDASRRSLLGMGEWRGAEIIIVEIKKPALVVERDLVVLDVVGQVSRIILVYAKAISISILGQVNLRFTSLLDCLLP